VAGRTTGVRLQLPRPGLSRQSLHDVDEPLGFVRHALADELRYRGGYLNEDRTDDCVAYLSEVLVRLARRYDPDGTAAIAALREPLKARTATRAQWGSYQQYLRARARRQGRGEPSRDLGRAFADQLAQLGLHVGPRLSFSSWAYSILRRRYSDWLRWSRGDSRYGNEGRKEAMGPEGDEVQAVTAVRDELDFSGVLEEINHDKLSARARGTLYELARPIAEERISITEAANRIGKTRREASRDLDRLREEMTA